MTENFKERFLAARREYIASRFPDLNDRQKEAVLATEGPLLVLAGAGSGKTTVLINRIYNIMRYGCASDSDELPEYADEDALRALETHGEDADRVAALNPAAPWQILAITFTNKAAGEMKLRLENQIGEAALDIWACTFHSACVRMLRRDCDRLGFTTNFNIYDTADSNSLMKHILKDMEVDEKYYPPRAVLNEISRAKDAYIWPEEYLSDAKASSDQHRIKIGELYKEYMHRLVLSDSMDFDDLLLYTVQLLRDHEDVRSYWQRRFRYVMIDEYQDTNALQYEFASLISGERKNICVVGDDDQSIYKFRGATIENILSFEERYSPCRTIRLEQNYRSTGHILNAANAVIRNNIARKGKELWTAASIGDPLTLFVAENENEEAQYVASKILSSYSKGEMWSDNAVLYRKNAQSNSLEYALKRNGIPYRIFGGTRFFDRAEIKDVLSYMCVIAAPADNLRLERIINTPARGIGPKSVAEANRIAEEEGTSLFDIISRADRYEPLARAAVRMREFSNMIRELRIFAESNTPDELFDEILAKTGYIRALEEKNDQESITRIENVKELKSTILTYRKDTGDETLSGYLANVALYTDLDNYDQTADAVTLMTMHASKGLEFPHVFIVGAEENIFPGMQAIGNTDEMEEERRLCYVAITRAKRSLDMICARQRMIFGRTSSNRPSRFIDEIPAEDLVKNDPRAARRQEAQTSSEGATTHREGYYVSPYYEARRKAKRQPEAKSFAPSSVNSAIGEKAKQTEAMTEFAVGDRVDHKAFHEGTISKLTPMGNDFLVEIMFDSIGSKKLMLRVAANSMKKI